MVEADLTRANLNGANLAEALLGSTNLTRTSLSRTDLTGAHGLTQDQLTSALGNLLTILPRGMTRPAAWQANWPA